MMARIGRALAHMQKGAESGDGLEQRVQMIEAVVDGIVERVEDLERRETEPRAEQRERH
jgi:hypothetical protein